MDRSPRFALIGASGMLGQALVELLQREQADLRTPGRAELDLLDRPSIDAWAEAERPEVVINAAAYTDVGRAELPEERSVVDGLNELGPGWLAAACVRVGARLVHVSTDYVFDGLKSSPYGEEDPVAPLQVYGQTKLEGERRVRAAAPDALIVRTSTLYGPGRRQRQRPHYVDAILGQARHKPRIEVVRLPISSPTYVPDLARAILELVQVEARGIVNAANAGGCSRLELAQATVDLSGHGGRVEVVERPEPEGGLSRPAYSVLATDRLAQLTRQPRPWREALADYLAESHGGA